MTLYAIYSRKDEGLPLAVAERFSWFAALLPPIHALSHGGWIWAGTSLAALVMLALAAPLIGGMAALGLYGLLALGFGLAAPGVERRVALRRGYEFFDYRMAADADLARLAALETRT